jgi:hypothetical protein
VVILAPPAVALASAVAARVGIAIDPAAEPEEAIRVLAKLTPAQRRVLQRSLLGLAGSTAVAS